MNVTKFTKILESGELNKALTAMTLLAPKARKTSVGSRPEDRRLPQNLAAISRHKAPKT